MLRLLGPMQVQVAGDQVELSSRKARGLLAYLALRQGISVPRETLCGLLWGDRAERQARASLRQTLSALRKALGEKAFAASNESVTLADAGVWVDLEALRGSAESASLDALMEATTLFRGELLEGLTLGEPAFDQWLTAERERTRLLLCQLLSRLVDSLTAEQRVEEAIAQAAQLLVLDPLQECVHRTLMRLYLAQGRHDAALSQFEVCRRELADELQVTPEKETLDLLAEIKARRRQSGGDSEKALEPHVAVAPRSDRPTIAVLPFTNLSGDQEQGYFAEGITEDIITELGRFRSLCVIAGSSTFAYKARTPSLHECGAALGAGYIVEGSVRRAGPRLRITAQLLEVQTGTQIWAERYDGEMEDIFALQDKVTRKIVSTLVGHLEDAEQRRVMTQSPEALSAYDLQLRGKSCLSKGTMEDILEARRLFAKAVDLDPGYAAAYVELALTYYAESISIWTASPETAREKTLELAYKAVELDPHDSYARRELAWAHFNTRLDFDVASAQVEEALRLNPNDYYTYCFKGWLSTCAGDLEDAQTCVNAALARSPMAADGCLYTAVASDYLAGNYIAAIANYGRICQPDPEMHAWAAAAYAQQDRLSEAQAALELFYEAVRPYPIAPARDDAQGWRAYWDKKFPARDPAARDCLIAGLRKAGLPI